MISLPPCNGSCFFCFVSYDIFGNPRENVALLLDFGSTILSSPLAFTAVVSRDAAFHADDIFLQSFFDSLG